MSRIAAPICAALFALSLVLLGGCATKPSLPEWTYQPAREVDNGYIVYTGSGLEGNPGQAQLAAQGTAIQDLANECSFVPKGARVENQLTVRTQDGFESYSQVAVEYDTCETAQNTVQPDQIRALASVPFTQELQRYQNLIGNPSQVASIPARNPGAPPVVTDDVDFFFARQYVYSQKQIVILAPPGVYVAGSVQTRIYVNNVTRVIRPMQAYYVGHPRLRSAPMTWSAVEPRVHQRYPRAFHPPARRVGPRRKPNHPRPNNRPKKKRRRRKNAGN